MDYILHLAIIITIFSILAVSLNYLAGYAGIISLNHASFYGIGAYTSSILVVYHGYSFLGSMFWAIVISGLIGYLSSIVILRLKDDAMVLVSFGFTMIIYNILMNWSSLTRGPLGIKGIPPPDIMNYDFFNKWNFLFLCLGILLLVFFFLRRITTSTYGTVLKSIRENETVAAVGGHNTKAIKRSVFTLGSCIAAIAGSLFASYQMYIDPNLFTIHVSLLVLIMVILGGMASLGGSVLGVILLTLIPELLRFIDVPDSIIGELRQIIYGAILVLIMFVRPQGVVGEYKI